VGRPSPPSNVLPRSASRRETCLQLEDHSTCAHSATSLFDCKHSRNPSAQAAILAEQFVTSNRALAGLLDVSLSHEYDGIDVNLLIRSGSSVGAVPLVSPLSARLEFALVVQPRFPWSGIGPVLDEIGWRIVPEPLPLPMLRRSERRVPLWVLSSMVLNRMRTLLASLSRRFQLVSEMIPVPKGAIHWAHYASTCIARGNPLSIPATFPDLRQDQHLQSAIRYTLDRQLESLTTQVGQGTFVQRLIQLAESLHRQVAHVLPRPPSPADLAVWQRHPLLTMPLAEGIEAIQWTVDNRGLAGLSDLAGVPWRLPMEAFFEAWTEAVFQAAGQQLGGRIRVGRTNDTVHPIDWQPPHSGSQRSLRPDLMLEFPNVTVIVDAKYKRHWDELTYSSWNGLGDRLKDSHRADLFQILAYGNLAPTSNVLLCLAYPSTASTWEDLYKSHRWIHKAEFTVGVRQVRLWLMALPMNAGLSNISGALSAQLQPLLAS
jgi:hypothetical protein